MARKFAAREVQRAVERMSAAGQEVAAGAVLVNDPMPEWSVEEIRSVHVRMHRAEGVLFRDALARAVRAAGLRCVEVPEKQLDERAQRVFGAAAGGVRARIATLGKTVGPPWGMDQKDATLAALLALRGGKG